LECADVVTVGRFRNFTAAVLKSNKSRLGSKKGIVVIHEQQQLYLSTFHNFVDLFPLSVPLQRAGFLRCGSWTIAADCPDYFYLLDKLLTLCHHLGISAQKVCSNSYPFGISYRAEILSPSPTLDNTGK
jgi:hypothetical protein